MAFVQEWLWAKTEMKMNAATLSDKRVLLMGFAAPNRTAIREMLQDIGVRLTAMIGAARHPSEVADIWSAFDCVIIDFDAYADTEDGVDALLELRRNAPRMAVLLTSAQVKGDDLSGERAAICDATVQLPLTRNRLRHALCAAFENHGGDRLARRA